MLPLIGFFISFVGGAFLISGLVMYSISYRLCLRIVQETLGEPNSLSSTDIWLNTRTFRKRRKLRSIADSTKNANLRSAAIRSLRLELRSGVLFFFGIVSFAVGALIIGSMP